MPTACEKAALRTEYAERSASTFRPRCTEDGAFSSMQCQNSSHTHSQACWCVDSDGEELPATRGTTSKSLVDGDRECERLRQQCYSPSLVKNACTGKPSHGRFSFDQASGGCVQSLEKPSLSESCDHEQIQGFESEQACQESCSSTWLFSSSCSAQLEAARIQEARGLLGVFHPVCTEDGSWQPLQCLGSLGLCWCVDVNGEALASTSQAPNADSYSKKVDSCTQLRAVCTQCSAPGEVKCTRTHQAMGMNCALGHCVTMT